LAVAVDACLAVQHVPSLPISSLQNLLNLTWSEKTMDGRRPWTGKRQFDSQTLGVDNRGLKQHVMMLPTDMVSGVFLAVMLTMCSRPCRSA
jgi:hypothetical protein